MLKKFYIDYQKKPTYQKVGLTQRRTGIPTFVCFATQMNSFPEYPLLIKNTAQLNSHLRSVDHILDRMILSVVESFFHLGGKEILLLVFKINKTKEYKKEILDFFNDSIFEKSRNVYTRKGFLCIKDFIGFGDIMLLPQLSYFFNSNKLFNIYTSIYTLIDDMPPYFVFYDPPFNQHGKDLINWTQKFNHKKAALFYPWVVHSKAGIIPPSICAAAIIQQIDTNYNCTFSMANQNIGTDLNLINEVESNQIHYFVSNRINIIRKTPLQNLVFWGQSNLGRGDDHSLINIERMRILLIDAIENIIEKYVMEPKTLQTCKQIEERITSFFESLIQDNFFYYINDQQNIYDVSCTITSKTGRSFDSRINIEVSYPIENMNKKIGFGLEIN